MEQRQLLDTLSAASVLALLLWPSALHALLMQPADPRTSNWDTWLLVNESHINYFYLKGTNCTPSCLNHLQGWDGVGLATAPLGSVSFNDQGQVLHRDAAAPDVQWLGSGSVYRAPNRSAVGGARYIMTYSQGPGTGDPHPTTAAASQKIYFALSDDLNTWRKTDAVFETDTSLYKVATGAWDCIATLPAADGSLYGYFFADSKQTAPLPSGRGGGFAHSVRPPHLLRTCQHHACRSVWICARPRRTACTGRRYPLWLAGPRQCSASVPASGSPREAVLHSL